jgi:hypothetical protein
MIEHTTRHGKSHGALPPPFETGKKGAMPEPALRNVSILNIPAIPDRNPSGTVPLSRYCPYFSIVTTHTPASTTTRSVRSRSPNFCKHSVKVRGVRGSLQRCSLGIPAGALLKCRKHLSFSPGQSRLFTHTASQLDQPSTSRSERPSSQRTAGSLSGSD